MVGENTCPGVRLKHRSGRFLDLEEKRIAFACHEKQHPAGGADTAHTHYLDGSVAQFIAVEQGLLGMV
jgi:hypothetical protein